MGLPHLCDKQKINRVIFESNLLYLGADANLVVAPVFKTEWGARAVPGGFDSHTFPPIKHDQQLSICSVIDLFVGKNDRKVNIFVI